MRLLVINSVAGIKSTGRIAFDIVKEYESMGFECKIAYGRDHIPKEVEPYAVKIGSEISVITHSIMSLMTDKHGCFSILATKKFLRWADSFNPDILWLHNIHGYYVNYRMLFDWIKKRPQMEVKWTLHDCWAFTGHCVHFESINCERWKSGCGNCPKLKGYPRSLLADNSRENFIKKKDSFTGVKKLELFTPSEWLAGLVRQSYLNNYPVSIRNNKIDLATFQRTPSQFKEAHGINNKMMILGVASIWTKSKGFYDFLELRERLSSDYAVVMVGVKDKQKEEIGKKSSKEIVCIPRTNSKQELAEIYSAADVFVNLTHSDTYPTVNLEAQACGTPVITFDAGGSPESVPPENVVPVGDLKAVVELIERGNLRINTPKG